jgi:hypothetical protein
MLEEVARNTGQNEGVLQRHALENLPSLVLGVVGMVFWDPWIRHGLTESTLNDLQCAI